MYITWKCAERTRKTHMSFVNFERGRRSHAKRNVIILHGKWGGYNDEQLQFSGPSDIYTYSWWCKIGNIMFVLMVDTRTLSMIRQPIFETSKNDRCRMARHIFLEALTGNVIGAKFKKLTAKINHEASLNKIPGEARKKKSGISCSFSRFFLTRLHFASFFFFMCLDFSEIKNRESSLENQIDVKQRRDSPRNICVETICGFMFRK